METQAQNSSDIVKRDDNVLFLKSKFSAHTAILTLIDSKLNLEVEDSGIMRRGLIVFLPFLRSKLEIRSVVFDLGFSDIKSIAQGSHGLNKNVLEVTDKQNNVYCKVVKSYDDWANLINPKL